MITEIEQQNEVEENGENIGQASEVKAPTPIVVSLATGNFKVILSGVPTAEYAKSAVEKGMVYDLQRDGATKAYLAIDGIPGKKSGSLKLPEKGRDGKDWSRDSIPYSVEDAETMKQAAVRYFGDKLEGCKVVVIQHVKEESADGRDTARGLIAKWSAEGKLQKKLVALDYEGDEGDADAVVEFVHEQLLKRA